MYLISKLDDFKGKCFQNSLSGFKGYIALNFLLHIIN